MNRPFVSVGILKRLAIFFMKCHNYQAQRVELIRLISQHTSIALQTLLFGTDSLPIKVSKGAKIRNRYNQVPHLTQDINTTIKIFEAMPTYIVDTNRF